MSIPKVMGIETEYGIITRGDQDYSPILGSSLLINSYASPRLKRVLWDYEEENPLRDARGFEKKGIDHIEDEAGLVSVILENGARFYVDHAHPEYSTPECTNARQLVIHDKAGERVLAESMKSAQQTLGPESRIIVYKNNSDGKGNSYGTHENYLVDRACPFPSIVSYLTPFLVSRQIFTGAGKVGAESGAADDIDFQISQRADFFEVEVGLETTFKRPIINTRDEPHADPEKYRRLHVIIGDANMSEIATFLKTGTTALVLKMIEDDFISADLTLAEPVSALRTVSHDPTCKTTITLSEGRTVTAVELQWEFFDWARKYLEDQEIDSVTSELMATWERHLTVLESDPMGLAEELDWVAKLQYLEAYRDRHSLDWASPKVAMADLQYHDLRPEKSLYHKLVQQGRFKRLVTDEEIEEAVSEPPEDTRAWFRGKVLKRFSAHITAASWDGVVFDVGGETLRKVPMMEPLRGTKESTHRILSDSKSASELLDQLST